MSDLKGLTAVVTGAGSGIGRALAERAAREGMNVAIADMNLSALESVAAELEKLGASVLVRQLDVSDAQAMDQFASDCFAKFNSVDRLFNNAGILRVGCTWEKSLKDWELMFSINVLGVVNGLNAFVQRMLDAGNPAHIVNTGSIGSLVSQSGMGQYTACKMAVRGITECLSLDLQMQMAPINVSLLCPGPVSTNIADAVIKQSVGEDIDPGALDEIRAATVAADPNFITPEDCAEKVFDAIAKNKFWIFTHPITKYYRGLTDAILNGENPSYSAVEFD